MSEELIINIHRATLLHAALNYCIHVPYKECISHVVYFSERVKITHWLKILLFFLIVNFISITVQDDLLLRN